jgi:aminocarboxymuconate-semialdehyde decarboxylase
MTEPAPKLIDFHAHFLDPELLKQAEGKTVLTGFGTRQRLRTGAVNQDTYRRMIDPGLQVADMDNRGIDINVISSATVIQGTGWADPATDLELCRRCNDRAAEWVAGHPGRFAGTFVLPLQDADRALGEMTRAVDELGLRIANLCTQYQDAYIGEAPFQPFWKMARDKGVVVWVHPDGVRDLWYQKFGMWNSIGQSIEEAKVMASLVYEGIPERFPEVPIVISHGGGYFPHNMGRMDRNVTNRPDSMANISKKPSDYLRNFYYDTCLFNDDILPRLVECVGADRLVMGSDYPVGEADPVGFIDRCNALSPADMAMIKGGTAARLLSWRHSG